MATATRRLNFMLKGEVADEFEALVPVGMRSKLVNEALSKELAHLRKQQTTDKLKILKNKMPAVSTKDLVTAVRAARDRA